MLEGHVEEERAALSCVCVCVLCVCVCVFVCMCTCVCVCICVYQIYKQNRQSIQACSECIDPMMGVFLQAVVTYQPCS